MGRRGSARADRDTGCCANNRGHAFSRSEGIARVCDRARFAAGARNPIRLLPGGPRGHHYRCIAGHRPDQRRNGAAAVHRAQPSVLQPRSQRADRQSSGRDLPVRPEPLRGLAKARLDRRLDHHLRGARLEHHCARALSVKDIVMSSIASITHGVQSPVPTVVDRSANHAGKSAEKILIRNLNFYYGDNKALKSINVPLYDRKVTAFIGPSGCGKSTLLRILNRIYSLYPHQWAEGDVLLDGTNILDPGQDLNRLRARVGMVFQKPTPFPMSIYENIAFGVRLFEELIDELKDDYTIAIVTHNMQQAARVSDYTAFMYLGELVEFDTTSKMFTTPGDQRTQDYITGRFG